MGGAFSLQQQLNRLSVFEDGILILVVTHGRDQTLTQVMMEKKAKVRTALAASAMTVSGLVLDHWLARTQKQMNHRNVQKPAAC